MQMKIKKSDVILAVIVLAVAAVSLAAIYMGRTRGGKAQITIGGEPYRSIDLAKNERIEIRRDDGINVIVVKDGMIYMESADCPDKICVNHSPIRYKGETIVCLPHKLVVEITDGQESEADVVAR